MRRGLLLAAVGVVLLTLGAAWSLLGHRAPADAAASATSAVNSSASVASSSSTAAPAAVTASASGQSVVAGPAPMESVPTEAAGAQGQQAAARAREFALVFANPGGEVEVAAWWARVRPLLSEAGVRELERTDPAQVPFTTVTGPVAPLAGPPPAPGLVGVIVPTDGGMFLVRVQAGAPYAVSGIERAAQ